MKHTNSKTYWLVFIGVVLAVTAIVFCIWLPFRDKTKAPDSNQNTNNSTSNLNSNTSNLNSNQAIQDKIDQYSQAIVANPENVQNYIDKSAAEYSAGDKEAAIATVNEGLVIDPNNDLLKNRKDVLEKDFISNSNIDTTRE